MTPTTTSPRQMSIYNLFVNDQRLLQENYEQYLNNRLREDHPSPEIPIIFSTRSRNTKDEKRRR